MLILLMWMFSTTPPRPRVLLKRKPTSVPKKVQLSTKIFFTPPDISLPTTKPPWPCNTWLFLMMMFWQGSPRLRPFSSLPDLIQIPSSPASKLLLAIITPLHDSTSMASPFCEYQGFDTVTLLMVRFWHDNGCKHQLGEFLKVTSSNKMFLHLRKLSKTGRNQSCMLLHSSSVLIPSGTLKFLQAIAPFIEPSLGYQTSPFASRTPPDATSFFHCVPVSLFFLTGRQVSPLPSMTPFPVIAMFSAPTAERGDWQRRVSSPSKDVSTIG